MVLINSKIVSYIQQFIVGAIFLFSAISKLLSIDSFEIYIYSSGILSLNVAYLLARFVVSVEIIIGLLLIFNLSVRYVKYAALGLLAVFMVYLFSIINSPENCHCFGELLDLSPWESVIKNLVIIILVLLIRPGAGRIFPFRRLFATLIIIGTPSVILILSPPDFIYTRIYPVNTEVNSNEFAQKITENNDFPFTLEKGKKIVCFYSPACRYCKMAAGIISVIAQKKDIPKNDIVYIFFGDEEMIRKFYKESGSEEFPHTILPTQEFLEITKGEMPLILLLDNGVIKGKYSYRNLDETPISSFFK